MYIISEKKLLVQLQVYFKWYLQKSNIFENNKKQNWDKKNLRTASDWSEWLLVDICNEYKKDRPYRYFWGLIWLIVMHYLFANFLFRQYPPSAFNH